MFSAWSSTGRAHLLTLPCTVMASLFSEGHLLRLTSALQQPARALSISRHNV